ncbi:hypothetical protein OEZ85_001727 [Tetradesmus obliquus]|uniref:Uncharacterized protein n=1 Tax=Tetradesmus obliquus TaxID=3088 RepID=A0ABY8U0Q2_TETOB|nr:hypothetical protein OEZ85_001727 [Tetradesmus obliquus]
MAAAIAPTSQDMTAAAEFDVCNGEERIMAFESFDMAGKPVHGLLTDRRIILRESSGSCGFPLDLCCVCFKAETDSSYSILDLKSVQPYVASGCAADCMATMFKLATTNPLCCCLPKMLPNGVRLGFSRVGDLVPSWLGGFGVPGVGPNFHRVHLQLQKEDALKLRKLLATHPNSKGLKYTEKA